MSCTTTVNAQAHQAERTCGRAKGWEGQERDISLCTEFSKSQTVTGHLGSAGTGSLCKCTVGGGRSSSSLPQPCPFVPVVLLLPLSSTDTVSHSCWLLLHWLRTASPGPQGELAPTSQAAAHLGEACQRGASVSSPYLLGRAQCDGGL